MSHGHPLTDEDREPWLLTIREKALELTDDAAPSIRIGHDVPLPTVRKLAEVHETSQQPEVSLNSSNSSGQPGPPISSNTTPRACVIACSALKRRYRDLLRGQISSLGGDSHSDLSKSKPSALRVFHIFLDVPADELLRRMHNRQGHFMKEGMLRSQLDALERPDPTAEADIVAIKARDNAEDTTKAAVDAVRAIVPEVCGPAASRAT